MSYKNGTLVLVLHSASTHVQAVHTGLHYFKYDYVCAMSYAACSHLNAIHRTHNALNRKQASQHCNQLPTSQRLSASVTLAWCKGHAATCDMNFSG